MFLPNALAPETAPVPESTSEVQWVFLVKTAAKAAKMSFRTMLVATTEVNHLLYSIVPINGCH